MAKIRAIIPEDRFVPTLGKGPFREPVLITEELYRMLKRMNYIVYEYKEEEVKEDTPVVEVEEVIEEDTPVVEVEEVIEDDEEEIEEEVIEDDEEEIEPIDLLSEELLSELDRHNIRKKRILEIYSSVGIEHDPEDTIHDLLALVGIESK